MPKKFIPQKPRRSGQRGAACSIYLRTIHLSGLRHVTLPIHPLTGSRAVLGGHLRAI